VCARSEFQPKNILFTGGCGFIGSHVINMLVKKYPEYKFVNLDCLDRCASSKNVSASTQASNYVYCHGSICNLDLVAHLMEFHHIDTVMHFAAQSHVDASFGNPLIHTQTNVLGTHTLLEAARRYDIKRFIHVSTDEVYGDVLGEGVVENAMFEPTNPYSCSKAAAEFIVKAYQKSYGLPVIITRGNNVYGPHQYPEKVIPKFILRLLKGDKCCLHGNGDTRRSYVHVHDVARAFDLILHKGVLQEAYNIGSPFEISMRELAESLVLKLGLRPPGKEGELVECVADRNINDKRYAINDAKLKALGWMPEREWDEGIEETIAWYKSLPEDYWPEWRSALAAHPISVTGPNPSA
jgi:UDP-glucose 4,6-dehydratase